MKPRIQLGGPAAAPREVAAPPLGFLEWVRSSSGATVRQYEKSSRVYLWAGQKSGFEVSCRAGAPCLGVVI